ncbi:hypothetical protein [Streptomyces celluloflavus]|uniref:hypothetical protein n=1 Tax=Streptomyces celluloflavus TaxID=58344 RepID=UPI0036663003
MKITVIGATGALGSAVAPQGEHRGAAARHRLDALTPPHRTGGLRPASPYGDRLP